MITTPPRILDFWEAFDRLEPLGEKWFQTATIARELSKLQTTQAASVGVEIPPQTLEDFMPARYSPPKTRKRTRKGRGLNQFRAEQEARRS